MDTGKIVRIMLVDDHPLFRRGLRDLLETDSDFKVMAEAGDGSAALRYASSMDIDVILMDIELSSDINGLDLTAKLNDRFPKPAILMMSMHNGRKYVERAKKAGAHGYVLKEEPAETIMHAIDEVMKGRFYWPRVKVDHAHTKPPTRRQMQVLKYIAEGMQSKQIAKRLGMKERTVEAHRLNIRYEFNINTQPNLVLFAVDCMGLYGIPGDGPETD